MAFNIIIQGRQAVNRIMASHAISEKGEGNL
jgi:hypothetical protein